MTNYNLKGSGSILITPNRYDQTQRPDVFYKENVNYKEGKNKPFIHLTLEDFESPNVGTFEITSVDIKQYSYRYGQDGVGYIVIAVICVKGHDTPYCYQLNCNDIALCSNTGAYASLTFGYIGSPIDLAEFIMDGNYYEYDPYWEENEVKDEDDEYDEDEDEDYDDEYEDDEYDEDEQYN